MMKRYKENERNLILFDTIVPELKSFYSSREIVSIALRNLRMITNHQVDAIVFSAQLLNKHLRNRNFGFGLDKSFPSFLPWALFRCVEVAYSAGVFTVIIELDSPTSNFLFKTIKLAGKIYPEINIEIASTNNQNKKVVRVSSKVPIETNSSF